jgi:hypothetical protein
MEEHLNTNCHIDINGVSAPTFFTEEKTVKWDIVKTFTVLWPAWELDSLAWVVENANHERKVIFTNHGNPYFVTKEFLKEKIEEYKYALKDAEEVLALIM